MAHETTSNFVSTLTPLGMPSAGTRLARRLAALHEPEPVYGPITASSPEWIGDVVNWYGKPLHSSPPTHDPRVDTRPTPREVIQAAHKVPADILNALDEGKVEITSNDIVVARNQIWTHRMHPIFFGGKIVTTKWSAIQRALPHIWAATAQYTEIDECRNFAALFKTIWVHLGYNAWGRTLDFGGKHSYNEGVGIDDATGDKVARVIEPQANAFVDRPYPKHGYVGEGEVEYQ